MGEQSDDVYWILGLSFLRQRPIPFLIFGALALQLLTLGIYWSALWVYRRLISNEKTREQRKPLKWPEDVSKIGIIGAILGFAVTFYLLNSLAGLFGLPFIIDYEETVTIYSGYGESETDGGFTDVGFYLVIVSFMIAWRSYGWFAYRRIWGNATERSKRLWWYWLNGLTVTLVLTQLLRAAPIPDLLFAILYCCIVFSVAAIFVNRFISSEAKKSRDSH